MQVILNSYDELNESHKDVLLELGNIGTGNALTALSQMTDRTIRMDLPSIKVLDLKQLMESMDNGDTQNVGVVILVHGDLECVVIFILTEQFAKIVGEDLTGEPMEGVGTMSEFHRSALCEVGNIMCNSYLNALASMLSATLDVSVPSLKTGTNSAILDGFAKNFEDSQTEILFIENTFYYSDHQMTSHILMHPRFESLQIMLDRLGG